MAVEWYYGHDGKEIGPVTSAELKELALAGRLHPTDFVWKEGMPQWIEATRVSGLFDGGSSTRADQPNPQAAAPAQKQASAPAPAPHAATPPAKSPAETAPAAARSSTASSASVGAKAVPAIEPSMSPALTLTRQSFGAAFGETLVEAISSLVQLITRPLRYGFLTVVFLISVMLTVSFPLTIVLLPVFAIGYILAMRRMAAKEPVSLQEFVGFMRNGWNSLWQIAMLLAGLFVTFAVLLAPSFLVMMLMHASLSSVDAGIVQATKAPPAHQSIVKLAMGEWDAAFRSPASWTRDASPDGLRRGEFFKWLESKLGQPGTWLVTLVVNVLASFNLIVIMAPLIGTIILGFWLCLDVARQPSDSPQPFQLVYDSCGRMFHLAAARWKRLACTAVYLPLVLVLMRYLFMLLSEMLSTLKLVALADWVWVVLWPIAMFVYIVYGLVLAARTSLTLAPQRESGVKAFNGESVPIATQPE